MRGLNWTGPAFSCGRPLSVLWLTHEKTETWKQHHTAINTTGLLFCSRDRKRDLRKRWKKSAERESKTEKTETRQRDRACAGKRVRPCWQHVTPYKSVFSGTVFSSVLLFLHVWAGLAGLCQSLCTECEQNLINIPKRWLVGGKSTKI